MRAKVIGFILGCIIGGLIGGYQISAWAEPIGAVEEPTMTQEEARAYLESRRVEVPDRVRELCEFYGMEYDISPSILEGVGWIESRYIEDVKNGNCIGLMQVNRKAQRERIAKLDIEDLSDVESNIHVATDLLAELLGEYPLETALNAYNGKISGNRYGSRVMKLAEAIEISEWD